MKLNVFFGLRSIVVAAFIFFDLNATAQNILSKEFKLVNSRYDEMCPVLSPDGKALYFTVAKHPDNVDGKKDPGDIWVSLWRDSLWSTPVSAGSEINDVGYNAVAGFSNDGEQLFLLSHYNKNNLPATQGIAVSRRTDSGWSVPENISIPFFLNRSDFLSGMINKQNDVFIFSAESYGSIGVEDIYVSLKKDGRWQEPINLGSTINTSSQELSPSISEDGKVIYFSTNGRRGYGGFDIYKSKRLDETWTSWSTPENLGPIINSEARELFFRPTQSMTLFTTTRNSDGYGDIRTLIDSAQQKRNDSIVKVKSIKATAQPGKNIVIISGKVTDSKTGTAINASIFIKADSSYSTNTSADGYYSIAVSPAKGYSIEVKSVHYVNLSEHLDLRALDVRSIELNFKLQPIEVGAVVNLKSILFYMGTTSLLEESYPELDVVVDFLKSNPKVEIELEGHTDNRGDTKKNITLSQQRVEKIKSYLVSKGIASRRIKGKGFGGSRPVASNENEETRKLNRRVDFLILKD